MCVHVEGGGGVGVPVRSSFIRSTDLVEGWSLNNVTISTEFPR